MSNMVETLKNLVGYTETNLDFLFVLFSLILLLFVFYYMLNLINHLFKWISGSR